MGAWGRVASITIKECEPVLLPPETPSSREEWRPDTRKPRKSSLEDEGSGDFQTIRNFGEDWAIILWKYLYFLGFKLTIHFTY